MLAASSFRPYPGLHSNIPQVLSQQEFGQKPLTPARFSCPCQRGTETRRIQADNTCLCCFLSPPTSWQWDRNLPDMRTTCMALVRSKRLWTCRMFSPHPKSAACRVGKKSCASRPAAALRGKLSTASNYRTSIFPEKKALLALERPATGFWTCGAGRIAASFCGEPICFDE